MKNKTLGEHPRGQKVTGTVMHGSSGASGGAGMSGRGSRAHAA
jgi:hypothetical protein